MKRPFIKVGKYLLANIHIEHTYVYYIGVFDTENKLLGVLSTGTKLKPYEICSQLKPYSYQQISYYGRKKRAKVVDIPHKTNEYEVQYVDIDF